MVMVGVDDISLQVDSWPISIGRSDGQRPLCTVRNSPDEPVNFHTVSIVFNILVLSYYFY